MLDLNANIVLGREGLPLVNTLAVELTFPNVIVGIKSGKALKLLPDIIGLMGTVIFSCTLKVKVCNLGPML